MLNILLLHIFPFFFGLFLRVFSHPILSVLRAFIPKLVVHVTFIKFSFPPLGLRCSLIMYKYNTKKTQQSYRPSFQQEEGEKSKRKEMTHQTNKQTNENYALTIFRLETSLAPFLRCLPLYFSSNENDNTGTSHISHTYSLQKNYPNTKYSKGAFPSSLLLIKI